MTIEPPPDEAADTISLEALKDWWDKGPGVPQVLVVGPKQFAQYERLGWLNADGSLTENSPLRQLLL
jgi:hypothetical protein